MVTKAGPLGPGEPDGTERYRPGYELVAEQILRYIAEEKLRPGSRLPTEQGLADLLGATRNVTREAVKVLAAIGRLSVRRGAGIFVAAGGAEPDSDELSHFQPTDMQHVLMLLDYRCLVESETARRAASIATPIEVRAIREAAEESAQVGERDDLEAFADADRRFHGAVSAAAANVFLQSAVASTRRFAAQSDVLLFHGAAPGSFGEAGRQHVEIAKAIADGEADRAAELMEAHIDTTRQQFQRRIRDRLSTRPEQG
ncbi:FadR/GntR family transcriptional regulator [Streptacidiphilus sp. N1-12]|uniref:FadR/GntR family transcriptional regulator n=2 Tax=Streptacidiphilus alkalitolerans TaxID=3342712 RepID=A0ABV6WIL2_9ACTN